jgi:hypothetical protein
MAREFRNNVAENGTLDISGTPFVDVTGALDNFRTFAAAHTDGATVSLYVEQGTASANWDATWDATAGRLTQTSEDNVQGTFAAGAVEVYESLNADEVQSMFDKLAGIEANATADQTGAEIKAAYEGEADTNAFTNALLSKLSGVESGATADQSNAEIEAAYNAQVAQVSAAEKTAGTATSVRRFSPKDVADMAGGLTISSQSPTTADITGAVNTWYLLNISGLTATRNLTLPTATAGDRIRITITTGDPDYELIIKGATTVTINNGTAATEWSRLLADQETVEFEATSSTNWQLTEDCRSNLSAVVGDTGTQQSISSSSGTQVTTAITSVIQNNGSCWNTTSKYYEARRKGTYKFQGGATFESMGDGKRIISYVGKNTGASWATEGILGRGVTGGANHAGFFGSLDVPVNVGDKLALWVFHDDSVSRNIGLGSGKNYVHVSVRFEED